MEKKNTTKGLEESFIQIDNFFHFIFFKEI